jgi:ribosomal protein S18 acetylase RimI-like enzyme
VTQTYRRGVVAIRPPRADELPILREIERRAGRIFVGVGLATVADEDPPPVEHLAAHVATGTAWVAVDDGDRPAGYAIASVVDGEGHLDQVSVDPDHGRRGLGRALVDHVCTWAAAQGFDAVTLTTYRDVPWNGPLYVRYGFEALADGELGPELAAIRAAERARGLDIQPRIAMRRRLG